MGHQRPRKYEDGESLFRKDKHGAADGVITIVSGRYDADQHRWMYTVKDSKKQPIAEELPEIQIGNS